METGQIGLHLVHVVRHVEEVLRIGSGLAQTLDLNMAVGTVRDR